MRVINFSKIWHDIPNNGCKSLIMKKTLTLILAISIGLAGMAQGKSNGKGHAKKADKHQKHADRNDRDHDDDRYERNDNRNDDYRNRRNNNAGKYSKNLPAKVRAAFSNDYPNATNVTWTKSNGHWTATFPNGIYRRSVTYAANGQRVNSNGSTSRRTTNNQEGSIWDKILSRE